jgi:hypothetical protein
MLRVCLVIVVGVVAAMASGRAAAQTSFNDVPPWHWAATAVERASASGVFLGSPANEHERAANALVQTYEAFTHPQHPGAVDWATRFLANLPPTWPEPLRRSRLAGYRFDEVHIVGSGDRRVVTFVVETTLRTNDAVAGTRLRARSRVEIRRDQDRWRVNYSDLAAGQPLLFK